MTNAPDPDALPLVRSLVGHDSVDMALKCFASLRRCHRPAFGFYLYDDNTLTDADRERLHAALAPVTIITRAEIAAEIDARLEHHPLCRAYRREHIFSAKVLDVPLHCNGPLTYSDSDILYLRPFTGFEPVRALCPRPVFMHDLWNTYALRYWELLNPWRVPLAERLNAGLMILQTAQVDLDFLEWMLGRSRRAHFSHFEQTYWSALARRDGGKLLDARQFTYPPEGGQPKDGSTVAWHFAGPVRSEFDAREAAARADDAAHHLPPVDLAVVSTEPLTVMGYLRSRQEKHRWLEARLRESATARPPSSPA